ncbi:MAG: hypothetical protein AB1426_11915 [Bacillota bacterium]
MLRKRWVKVLLVLVVVLSGCMLWQAEKATVTGPLGKAIFADLPLAWHQATGRLVDSAWVCRSGKAGYAEPPDFPIGQVTKEKLYASAWTAALLRQVNETVSPNVLALLDPWLDQLAQQEFSFSDGFPKLHNLYLYYLLQTSLGKTVNKAACLRVLPKLRHSSGLYRHSQARAFVAHWTAETLKQAGNDPFSIEVLLQLAELHQAVGSRLTLPSIFIQELTSRRGVDGGFSIQPGQWLEPQYTFKVQKLLLLVAGIPPRTNRCP